MIQRFLRVGSERRFVGALWLSVCLPLSLVLGALSALSVQAQGQAQPVDSSAIADVRIVIDTSGSMKKNDPDNLRQPSLALLLQLLSESSRAGVWTFDEQVNQLVKLGETSNDWKREAIQQSQRMGSNGLFTNIGAALEGAAFDLDLRLDSSLLRDPSLHSKPNPIDIILLTDGMVDIDQNPLRNEAERQRILEQILPQLQAAGYRVHTIALSDHADHEFLDQLALATDGVSTVAHSADGLMKAFLRLLDQATPAAQLPLTGNRFWVDDSIEEFTALVFRRPGSDATQLIRPDNSAHQYAQSETKRPSRQPTEVDWYRTEQYDLITVQRPMAGEWQIAADMAPDSRVTIVSNLNLTVKPLPNQVFVGEELSLSLRLQAQGETVTEAEFLSLLTINGRLEQEGESQAGAITRWQKPLGEGDPPLNGVYQTLVDSIPEAGDYRLSVVVDGKTFQRQFTHYFQARPSTPPAQPNSESSLVQPAAAAPLNTEQKQKLPAWVLYAALGGGNLLLSLLAFWAYRLVMKPGEKPDVDPNTNPETNPDTSPEEPHAVDLLEEPIGPIEIDLNPEVSSKDTSGDSGVDSLLAEFEQNWNDDTAGADPTNQPDK